LCVFRHQVFQPSSLSSCLQWAVLLLLLYTYNRDAGKRERKKGNSLPVSFYLLVATVANQKRSWATRISSSKCRCSTREFLIICIWFCFHFSGLQIAKCKSVYSGIELRPMNDMAHLGLPLCCRY
jgi:hypothetical protein